jgi:hypothetical protein
LLGDDTKPINQDRPGTLGGENLPSIMKDNRGFARNTAKNAHSH